MKKEIALKIANARTKPKNGEDETPLEGIQAKLHLIGITMTYRERLKRFKGLYPEVKDIDIMLESLLDRLIKE